MYVTYSRPVTKVWKQNNPLKRIADLIFSYSFVIAVPAIYHTLSSDSKRIKTSCWWTFSPELVSGLFRNLSTGKYLDPEINSG